jgi:Na+/proline symporter
LLGLLVASLVAAYVSTMSTHLNWGASYLVHDLYRRFVHSEASERHYVWVSRLVTAALMLVAVGFSFLLDTAGAAFHLLLSIGAGTGLIYLLRWYWWRINAWSEIAAMLGAFVVSASFWLANRELTGTIVPAGWTEGLIEFGVLRPAATGGWQIADHVVLLGTVVVTTLIWIVVTFLTPPVAENTLIDFCKKVKPAGPGWRRIRAEYNLAASPDSLPQALLGWVLGCTLVYAALFGAGSFLYGNTTLGFVCAGLFLISGIGLTRLLVGMWRMRSAGGIR